MIMRRTCLQKKQTIFLSSSGLASVSVDDAPVKVCEQVRCEVCIVTVKLTIHHIPATETPAVATADVEVLCEAPAVPALPVA